MHKWSHITQNWLFTSLMLEESSLHEHASPTIFGGVLKLMLMLGRSFTSHKQIRLYLLPQLFLTELLTLHLPQRKTLPKLLYGIHGWTHMGA